MGRRMKLKTKKSHRWKYLNWLWLPIIGALFYYSLWIFNPLPSDEEMIENFKAHRADFVEAVRRYREYPRSPDKDSSLWFKEGDTLELFKRAGIDSIDARGSWFPNPYSVETAIRHHRDILSGSIHINIINKHKYGELRIQPATTPRIDHPDQGDYRKYYRNTLLFGVIWKDYYFFPEVPYIQDGILFGPINIVGKGFLGSQFHPVKGVSTIQSEARVLPSLNHLPSNWKGFECVYRQIEPQWFIRMCNGRH